MSLQAIAFDKDDFPLFDYALNIAGHVKDCPDCQADLDGRCDDNMLFDAVNERLMVPILLGDYEGLCNAATRWMQVYLACSGQATN